MGRVSYSLTETFIIYLFHAMDPFSLAAGISGFAGLAGLFSTCLGVIERVDSYKDFGAESRSIIAQFEADKYLFAKWAQDVGIDKDNLKNNYHLDNPETILILQIFYPVFRKYSARQRVQSPICSL